MIWSLWTYFWGITQSAWFRSTDLSLDPLSWSGEVFNPPTFYLVTSDCSMLLCLLLPCLLCCSMLFCCFRTQSHHLSIILLWALFLESLLGSCLIFIPCKVQADVYHFYQGMNTLRQSRMLNLLPCLLNYCSANFANKCEQESIWFNPELSHWMWDNIIVDNSAAFVSF